jgi:hypothetical protein
MSKRQCAICGVEFELVKDEATCSPEHWAQLVRLGGERLGVCRVCDKVPAGQWGTEVFGVCECNETP